MNKTNTEYLAGIKSPLVICVLLYNLVTSNLMELLCD